MIVSSSENTALSRPNGDNAVEALRSSKLLAHGGYQIVPRLFAKERLHAMFDEAVAQFAQAKEEFREGKDVENWRGGLPPRRMLCAAGGPVQDQLYCAPELAMYLSEVIGVPVQASSNRASYSYYCRPGDHLAVHRDVEHCDISVIVVVSDNTSTRQTDGELVLYPDHVDDPLSAVRQDPERGAVPLKLAAGQTLILAGGMVPHLVQPVSTGQARISAPMCFKVIGT